MTDDKSDRTSSAFSVLSWCGICCPGCATWRTLPFQCSVLLEPAWNQMDSVLPWRQSFALQRIFRMPQGYTVSGREFPATSRKKGVYQKQGICLVSLFDLAVGFKQEAPKSPWWPASLDHYSSSHNFLNRVALEGMGWGTGSGEYPHHTPFSGTEVLVTGVSQLPQFQSSPATGAVPTLLQGLRWWV